MAMMSSPPLKILFLIAICVVAIDPTRASTIDSPTIKILLSRAESQAQSGHMDIAISTWKQVLASDPNNVEALRNLAGAEVQLGQQAAADTYIQRLKNSGASDAVIEKLRAIHARSSDAELQRQAAALAKSGQYSGAMEIYRQLYGKNPPAGEIALVYYDTEAALPAERTKALEGLRKLARQFPSDERYSITLGRVLTYDANTRSEGLALLRRYPADRDADDALKQSLSWAERPGTPPVAAGLPIPVSPRSPAVPASELAAGYRALNAGNIAMADQHFRAALAHEATHGQANAGLGYLSMRQQNFSEAMHQFEQARTEGDQDASLTQALATSRFFSYMGEARDALNADNTESAIAGFRSALALKPDNADALSALGGALLRAGRPKDAVSSLQRAVRANARSQPLWRALFLAQSQSSESAEAISTAERIPIDLRTRLETDPEFLGSLAADYAAMGQQAQSDHILKRALALSQTDNGSEDSIAKQLQYASLLLTAKRYNSASRTYRKILAVEPDHADAWRGLISADHLAGRDAEALQEFRQMPVSLSAGEQSSTSFLSMLAGIYQSQGQTVAARATLERALKIAPSLPLQLQLAALEMASGDKRYAADAYARLTDEHPESKAAWIGWLQALHATGQDREALHQIAEMPEDLSAALRDDPAYMQAIAFIYNGTGNKSRAADAIDQVNEIYARQGIKPPADVELQQGWLLLQSGQDARLARVIQELSNAGDLTEDQQTQITHLYGSWAVQRAAQLSRHGKPAAALAVLSAALRVFPSDIAINNALAAAYVGSGDPKRAVLLYARQNISQADSSLCESAIRAALAAGDRKQAQAWLQASLDRFGTDARLLELSAEFEVQRGDSRRAAAYYRAALQAEGPLSIGELTSSATHPGADQTESSASQELFRLLNSPSDISEQNQTREVAHADGDRRDPLWPVRSGSSSNESERPRSNRQNPDDTVALLPLETDTVRRQSRKRSAAPRGGAADAQDASQDDLLLPPLPPPTTPDSSGTPYMALSRGTESPVAVDAEDGSRSADRVLLASSKPSQFHLHRAARRQQINSLATDSSVPEAQALYPTVPDGVGSDDSVQLPKIGARGSIRRIPTVDTPALIATLAPLPSPQMEVLPPLTGASTPVQQLLTPRQQMQDHLDSIESSSSPYLGGNSSIGYHNGQPGFDRLTIFSADVEQSAMITKGARATLVVHPTLLQGGTATAGATFQLGTLPFGALSDAQTAAGVGGEVQLRTRSIGAAIGYTPHGFPVENVTGRLLIQPDAGPFTFNFERQPIEDSQLSYAGLHDPGSATASHGGNVWGGVITNAASVQINHGNAASGWYMQLGGQYLTGQHVEVNRRVDGFAGAYWSIWDHPTNGKLTLGMNLFGMHFANNQRLFTYGNGGYFSPGAYLLSNIPITYTGRQGSRFHYRIAGALGIQAFQEDASPYFPLDSFLQVAANNPYSTEHVSIGANYNADGEGSYLITENWHVGGFFSLDNSRGYNNDRLGFSLRYAFHPQSLESLSGPTGLGRTRSLRPLLIP